jgi:hypothetical protein
MEEQNDFRNLNEKPSVEEKHTFNVPSSGVYSDRRGGGNKILLIILGIIVIILIAATAYLFRSKFSAEPQSSPTPSPKLEQPVVVTTPEPTPQAIDRSQYTIRILNGTKTSGLAATVSAKLKDLGYKIERTGNATSSAFVKTAIRAKSNQDALISQLIKDLSPDYSGASSSALKANDPSDAEIILGTQ